MKVGFIGLGKLGAPMARHVAARHDLRATDRDPTRLAGVPAASIDALAAWADLIVTSLPDDAALDAVATALAPHLGPHQVWAETSTVSPEASARARAATAAAHLASPVSGSTATAEAAALTLFCSGPQHALATARPALDTFAKTIHHVGEAEEARFLKLAINHFVGTTAQVAAEALTLARKGGVAWDTLLNVLGTSVAASPLIAYKLGPLRARDFAPAFTVAQMAKDMGLTAAAAAAQGIDAPLATLVRDAYRRQAAAHGDQDFFAAILDAEHKAGLPEP